MTINELLESVRRVEVRTNRLVNDTMVLDQRHVRGAGGQDAGGPQLGHGHRLIEGQQPRERPSLRDELARRLIGPVGDDHLDPRRHELERVETAPEIGHAVHRCDDDRQFGLLALSASPSLACVSHRPKDAPPANQVTAPPAAKQAEEVRPGYVKVYSRCGGFVWMKKPT